MVYLDEIVALYHAGNATEHSYRPALKTYLEHLLDGITATNEPKRQKCGAPDYIISKNMRGTSIDIGYIEAKAIGVDLDKTEKSEQLVRYLLSLDNMILTDYIDFRFFTEGVKVAEIAIARLEKGKLIPLPENLAQLETLLHDFASFQGQTIKSAKTLAGMMARKARLMQEVFTKALLREEKHALQDQLAAFRHILIHDMDAAEFSDVYAQTITYGLFTARLHDENLATFSRREALELIPMSNPFLRKLFQYVALELDDSVAWIVDALCEVFRATNIPDILADFGKQSGRNDPIVHFYETFLAEYNPDLRKNRGVWYTPEPVVNFIIRAVDDCLKTHFNLPMGIADNSKVKIKAEVIDNKAKKGISLIEKEVHKVQLLDVATGTGTFISEVIKQIYYDHFKQQQGMWSNYVEEHLLPRLHGFEILMTSYAMCHIKIDMLLHELNYVPGNPKKQPRLGVYLTNSLEEAHPDAQTLFASWLAAEANEANAIKRDMPVMVAFGNPPYNVSTQNKGEWIYNLIADYKKDLNEKKINLDDDYIKFIRYAEHYIEKTGYGIVGMITNNSFLDGVTHRQMRKHLLETFDTIYIYDLHGSAKKKETAPDGSQDKNVFDIQQGVSISIFIKHNPKNSGKKALAEVYHSEIYGTRQSKFTALWANNLRNTGFKKLKYSEPYYFFVPKDFSGTRKYDKGFSITDLMTVNASGIETQRDKLAIQFTSKDILAIKEDLISLSDADFAKKYDVKNGRDWTISGARNDVLKEKSELISINYRPFDDRKTLYSGVSKGFIAYPRNNVSRHLLVNNLALIVCGQQSSSDFQHIFITNKPSERCAISLQTKEVGYCFPLYLYPTDDEQLSLDKQKRTPNFDPKIIAQIAKKLSLPFVSDHEDEKADSKTAFSPLDLLDYMYSVLHSPSYRKTYREFLKIDFPRVPYPENADSFWQLVALGREIRLLHLLESPKLAQFITRYPISGDNKVEKPEYKDGKVYINHTQYYDGVPEIIWNFSIGGYQPAQKWLKDRKGRALSFEDLMHYPKMIVALSETDRLMKEIDKLTILP